MACISSKDAWLNVNLFVYVIRWATEFLASIAIPLLLLHANEYMVKRPDGVRWVHLISSSKGLNHVSVRKRMSTVTNSFISVLFSSVPTDRALKRPMRKNSLHVDFDEGLLMIFISIKFPGFHVYNGY